MKTTRTARHPGIALALAMGLLATGGAAAGTDGESGEELLEQQGCYTCHAEDERSIGPSLQEIAARYAGDPDVAAELARRIIEGTTGRWGNEAMRPHPGLAMDDALSLARYILALQAE